MEIARKEKGCSLRAGAQHFEKLWKSGREGNGKVLGARKRQKIGYVAAPLLGENLRIYISH
jgi:hypothetical protein